MTNEKRVLIKLHVSKTTLFEVPSVNARTSANKSDRLHHQTVFVTLPDIFRIAFKVIGCNTN